MAMRIPETPSGAVVNLSQPLDVTRHKVETSRNLLFF